MNRLTRVFICGFMAWCVVGALFRLFIMTIRDQPYDAVPVITLALVATGYFIMLTDRKTPHE